MLFHRRSPALLAALLLTLSCAACSAPPKVTGDPPPEAFTEADYKTWKAAPKSAPGDLTGAWRCVDIGRGRDSTDYSWFQFNGNMTWKRGSDAHFVDGAKAAAQEGAFRVIDGKVVLHTQFRGGQGVESKTLDRHVFKVLDANSILLEGMTRQTLTLRYLREDPRGSSSATGDPGAGE